jgi:hypothetical protein
MPCLINEVSAVHDYMTYQRMLDPRLECCPMLAFIMMLVSGPAYQWRPDIDLSDSFVLSTLFADGGH